MGATFEISNDSVFQESLSVFTLRHYPSTRYIQVLGLEPARRRTMLFIYPLTSLPQCLWITNLLTAPSNVSVHDTSDPGYSTLHRSFRYIYGTLWKHCISPNSLFLVEIER